MYIYVYIYIYVFGGSPFFRHVKLSSGRLKYLLTSSVHESTNYVVIGDAARDRRIQGFLAG